MNGFQMFKCEFCYANIKTSEMYGHECFESIDLSIYGIFLNEEKKLIFTGKFYLNHESII